MNTARSNEQAVRSRAAGDVNSLGTLAVIPSGGAVGAEIRNVDLALPVPTDVQEALRKAWADHMVLVFRDQRINDDQLIEAATIFGGVQEVGSRKFYFKGGQGEKDHRVSRHPSITIVSNLDANGNPVKDNGALGSYEVMWHSDNTYLEVPPAGSMMYSLEIPPPGEGGETYANLLLRQLLHFPPADHRARRSTAARSWSCRAIRCATVRTCSRITACAATLSASR